MLPQDDFKGINIGVIVVDGEAKRKKSGTRRVFDNVE